MYFIKKALKIFCRILHAVQTVITVPWSFLSVFTAAQQLKTIDLEVVLCQMTELKSLK